MHSWDDVGRYEIFPCPAHQYQLTPSVIGPDYTAMRHRPESISPRATLQVPVASLIRIFGTAPPPVALNRPQHSQPCARRCKQKSGNPPLRHSDNAEYNLPGFGCFVTASLTAGIAFHLRGVTRSTQLGVELATVPGDHRTPAAPESPRANASLMLAQAKSGLRVYPQPRCLVPIFPE